MIKELCPNGVSQSKISEISFFITDFVASGSFESMRKNVRYKTKEEGYARLIRTVDFSNGFSEKKSIYVDKKTYEFLHNSNLSPGQIIICNIGSIGLVFKAPKLNIPMTLAPNAITLKTKFNDNFYFYYFKTKQFKQDLLKASGNSSMPKFNKTQFRSIIVPVPPLEIQNEIVKILDSFSELVTSISEGLPAEIKARKQQYEYYRNKLLTFEELQ
jgi:type I restriction enzyme S subunit